MTFNKVKIFWTSVKICSEYCQIRAFKSFSGSILDVKVLPLLLLSIFLTQNSSFAQTVTISAADFGRIDEILTEIENTQDSAPEGQLDDGDLAKFSGVVTGELPKTALLSKSEIDSFKASLTEAEKVNDVSLGSVELAFSPDEIKASALVLYAFSDSHPGILDSSLQRYYRQSKATLVDAFASKRLLGEEDLFHGAGVLFSLLRDEEFDEVRYSQEKKDVVTFVLGMRETADSGDEISSSSESGGTNSFNGENSETKLSVDLLSNAVENNSEFRQNLERAYHQLSGLRTDSELINISGSELGSTGSTKATGGGSAFVNRLKDKYGSGSPEDDIPSRSANVSTLSDNFVDALRSDTGAGTAAVLNQGGAGNGASSSNRSGSSGRSVASAPRASAKGGARGNTRGDTGGAGHAGRQSTRANQAKPVQATGVNVKNPVTPTSPTTPTNIGGGVSLNAPEKPAPVQAPVSPKLASRTNSRNASSGQTKPSHGETSPDINELALPRSDRNPSGQQFITPASPNRVRGAVNSARTTPSSSKPSSLEGQIQDTISSALNHNSLPSAAHNSQDLLAGAFQQNFNSPADLNEYAKNLDDYQVEQLLNRIDPSSEIHQAYADSPDTIRSTVHKLLLQAAAKQEAAANQQTGNRSVEHSGGDQPGEGIEEETSEQVRESTNQQEEKSPIRQILDLDYAVSQGETDKVKQLNEALFNHFAPMCEDYFGRGAPNFANYTPSNIGSDRPLHKISSIQLEGEGGQSARQDLTRFAQASLSEQIRRVNPRLGRLMGVAFPESVKLNGIQGQDNALPELDQDKQALVWDDSDEGIRVTIGECQQIDRAFDKVITDSFSQELTRFENEAQRAGYGSDGLRSSTFQKVKAICTSVISNRFSQGLAALEQNSHQEVRKQFFSQGHTNLGSADLSKLAESFHPIDWTASSEETLGALEIARVELEVFQEEAKGESENEASPTSPESSPELGEKSAGGELDLDALLGSFANESCVSRADGKWCPGTHNSMICAAFGVKKALHFQTTTTSIQRSPSVPAAQSTASQTNVRVRETVPESELVEQADDSQLNSAPERSPSNNQPNDDHNASDNEAAPDSALLEAFDPADLEF